MALSFSAGLALAGVAHVWPATSAAPARMTLVPRNRDVRPAAELSQAFVAMARSITPAVVRIESERPGRDPHAGLPPGLRDRFGIPPADTADTGLAPVISDGTGIIVAANGYILTNDHVVAGARRITVTLHDRRLYEADVVGSDPTTDVAVIRVPVRGLTAARLGDSDRARVGEWVLAVGNPGFGPSGTLDFTVTSGIISAKGRPLDVLRRGLQRRADPAARFAIEDFIQTDAVINPGNSGGPLVNLRGEVVGINTAIASRTGFYQGYGFAIPINLARRVMADLMAYGEVRRPVLGVAIRNVTEEDAQVYGLPRISGVLIQDFSGHRSPAEKAGLLRGDVVVALDSQAIERVGQLQRLVAEHRPGDVVHVRAVRYGRAVDARVRLALAPLEHPATRPRPPAPGPREEGLGIRVSELSPELAREMGFARPGGAVIAAVAAGSASDRAGLVPGLRIVSIDRDTIASAEQARRRLSALRARQVASLLLEQPAGGTIILNLRVP